MYGGEFAFQNRLGWPFSVFALFYFVFEDNVQIQAPAGLIFRGAISRSWKVFLCYEFEGFIFGGAYTWGAGGYFSEFYGIFLTAISTFIFVQVMLPVSMNSSHTSSCP